MLNEVLKYLRNYFPVSDKAERGEFVIENNTISLPFLSGQYYLVEGSVLNDGVHKYPSTDLADEAFKGIITPLAVPSEVIELAEEVEAYCAKYGATPYQSESFGGYSYTKSSGGSEWTDVYKSRLNVWRKI